MPRIIKWGHVPDNLPVVPDDEATLPDAKSRTTLARHSTIADAFDWRGFSLSADDIVRFRRLLEGDFGAPLPWNDDEVRTMAEDVIRAVFVLYRQR